MLSASFRFIQCLGARKSLNLLNKQKNVAGCHPVEAAQMLAEKFCCLY